MSDQDAEEADGDGEETEDGFEEGDFVVLSYTARTVEDDTLVDTTDQEVAEEEGVAEEGQSFEPVTLVLGAGHVFEPVEDAIISGEVGDEGTVVVPPEQAFGEFDDDQVRTISADKIPEDSRYPGAPVEVEGQRGQLETIIGGRARVDFNHPLAGEEIEYEYEVLEEVEEPIEKARGLLGAYLDVDLETWIETDEVEEMQPVESDDEDEEDDEGPEFEEVTVEKETLYVESTPQLSFNQQWLMQKQQIAEEIIERVGLDRVIIQEVIDGSGGMGGMMPGMGGGPVDPDDLEDAMENVDVTDDDVTADEVLEELEGNGD